MRCVIAFCLLGWLAPCLAPAQENPTPASLAAPAPSQLDLAKQAVAHLLDHFWTGTAADGHIVRAHDRHADRKRANRPLVIWEQAMAYFPLNNLYLVTHDPELQQRLGAEWRYMKTVYPMEKLYAVGERSGTNPACDDAGWSSMFFWMAWQRTGDPAALTAAQTIVKNAFARWLDPQEGGMWYADPDHMIGKIHVPHGKSTYATAVVLTSLHLYEQTHDRAFLDPAMNAYNWMETHLLRPDGIYWAGYRDGHPEGEKRPDDIREAGSVSFLGGNMGMGVLHATLYRITGDKLYLQRALRTAAALRASREVNADGVFVDDRDAWTDGTFAGEWAREVLTLPGMTEADRDLMRRTARAIATKDETADGYYGGCWDGPADGPGSSWSRGHSTPYQMMTSGSAANMIVAAASL